jgi:epoxyqueuosine reductase
VPTLDSSSIRLVAASAGADTVGITSAEPFSDALITLKRRKAKGMAGPLHFTYDDPIASTDVRRTFPWARSLVVLGCSYADSAAPPSLVGPTIGRFATADHYERVRGAARAVASEVERVGGRADLLVDDPRLVDRAAAIRAGLGWMGRSTMVLSPGHGPWQLFGSVVTDLELETTPTMRRTCGTCVACIPACPTSAITEDGVDARRCISTWLQAPGSIPHWVRPLVERRIYGCDDCLTSCPPGAPALAASPGVTDTLTFSGLLAQSDDDLLERFRWFYVPRRDARFLRRNLLVAAGNSEEAEAVGSILEHFTHRSSLVRGHAYWALARSLGADSWTPLRRRHAFESVPHAIDELERSLLMTRAPFGR